MQYLSVSAAQRCILNIVMPRGIETVPLATALGRVLAANIKANRDQPPYDVSAMDGFALRSADLAAVPAVLEVVEDIKAGDMPAKPIATGQCARIMTGAPLPAGADAVIRVEDTAALTGNRVQIQRSVKPGHDVRPLGEGMRNGEVVLAAGTEITPGVVGVLATVKARQVYVYRRPRVAILSTGNELEGMDEPVDPRKIPDSNSYALMAQMQALGLEPVRLGIARDDPQELEQYLRQGLEYDVLLVSGGTSVGVHDYVRPTVEALGVQMHFWRVAIRPGHPLAFGTTASTVVFGLPGNPVSSMVCVEEFVSPALRQMMGYPRLFRRTVQARLAGAVKTRAGRTEFVRVTLQRDGEGYIATSTGNQSSGALVSMSKADGLLVVPAERNGMEAGEIATVQLLDGNIFQRETGFHP